MKIVAISDTHNKHQKLILPEGDVLIHAGDVTEHGKECQAKDFLDWFSAQPHRYKVFIAGNHDNYFDKLPAHEINRILPDNVIYLNDHDIKIENIKIWGSAMRLWFSNLACNHKNGIDVSKHLSMIPAGIDILVTHAPVYGILDRTIYGNAGGCLELRDRIRRIRPKYSIFGHIHEAYGMINTEGTTFINASLLNENNQLVNKPFVFDLNVIAENTENA